jgi:hypothetical protein
MSISPGTTSLPRASIVSAAPPAMLADDQVVCRGLCERVRNAGDHRSARGGRVEKPAAVHHRSHLAWGLYGPLP